MFWKSVYVARDVSPLSRVPVWLAGPENTPRPSPEKQHSSRLWELDLWGFVGQVVDLGLVWFGREEGMRQGGVGMRVWRIIFSMQGRNMLSGRKL